MNLSGQFDFQSLARCEWAGKQVVQQLSRCLPNSQWKEHKYWISSNAEKNWRVRSVPPIVRTITSEFLRIFIVTSLICLICVLHECTYKTLATPLTVVPVSTVKHLTVKAPINSVFTAWCAVLVLFTSPSEESKSFTEQEKPFYVFVPFQTLGRNCHIVHLLQVNSQVRV